VAAPAYVGDDLAHQRDQCAGSVAWWATTWPTSSSATAADNSIVPPALTDYIKGRKGYDYSHHGQAGNPDAEFVPDEIIDRFCVLGSASSTGNV
jgi:hypothetical protein